MNEQHNAGSSNPKLLKDRIAEVCLRVCELPDRTSPDDWPEACLVTPDELSEILEEVFGSPDETPQPASNERHTALPALLREAERRVNQHVWGDRRSLVTIPADRNRDVDLLLMEAAAVLESLRPAPETPQPASKERASISAEGSELMMELFNRMPVESLKSVPEPIAKRIGDFMVANGYRIVFDRWCLQADPRGAPETAASLTPIEQLLVQWWGSEMDNGELFNRAVRLSEPLAKAMMELPERAAQETPVQPSQDERTLRRLLALAYSGVNLYRDDGELQDGSDLPVIDYVRDPISVIEGKIQERGLRKLAKANELKASERRGTPEEEADWAEFGDCPRCWRCAAPVITIPGCAPGCIRNCPPPPENGGAIQK